MTYLYEFKVREKGDKRPWQAIPVARTLSLDSAAPDFYDQLNNVIKTLKAGIDVQEIRYKRQGYCQAYFVN